MGDMLAMVNPVLCVNDALTKVLEVSLEREKSAQVLYNSLIVPVRCKREVSLAQLKCDIVSKTKKMLPPDASTAASDYAWSLVDAVTGEWRDELDESRSLSSLHMLQPFAILRLYEPEHYKEEKKLVDAIELAIDCRLNRLEELLDEELREYRAALFAVTRTAVEQRGQQGTQHFAFPEENSLTLDDECPPDLANKIQSASLEYHVFYMRREAEEREEDADAVFVKLPIEKGLRPAQLVALATRQLRAEGCDFTESNDDFLLQIAAKKSYATRTDKAVMLYEAVRSALEDYRNPQFVLRRREFVMREYPRPSPLLTPAFIRSRHLKEATKTPDSIDEFERKPVLNLWETDEMVKIRPVSCSNMDSSDPDATIRVEIGVFVGKTKLAQKSSSKVSTRNPRWNTDFINLDVYSKDIPSAAFLSLSLVEEKTTTKKGKQPEGKVIGWANVRLADWRDELRQGLISLQLNPPGECPHAPGGTVPPPLLNPFAPAPDRDRDKEKEKDKDKEGRGAIRLVVEMNHYRGRVKFPSDEMFRNYLDHITKWGAIRVPPPNSVQSMKESPQLISRLESLHRLQLLGAELTKDDEALIWEKKYVLRDRLPDMVTVLAECDQTWQSRENFAEFYMCLSTWGDISTGTALALLDNRFHDTFLRSFAVARLGHSLDNDMFPLFLLPLVQALKFEPNAFSDLAALLLRKALSDFRIGHKLFWLLRAEIRGISNPSSCVFFPRFALLVEAYLRGSDLFLWTLIKQVRLVDQLSQLSADIKNSGNRDPKRLHNRLRELKEDVECVISPLDPTCVLGPLLIEQCKVLGSAKLPIKLVWRNDSLLSHLSKPQHEIIFKNGDDLRQDMLVLQVLSVMDALWKRRFIDCCLSVYPVLPMGTKVGMIGVVPDASTIFEMQQENGRVGSAVKGLDISFINKYIRQFCKNSKQFVVFFLWTVLRYLECVDRFLMSIVGYSVATYVMGIKDRHNDNIMVTQAGRLFHIDFGHMLGHGKKKLGIQRDRVPFVLTEHFLYVIRQGRNIDKDSHEVRKLLRLCTFCFVTLYEHRDLIQAFFSVAQAMGLPELRTRADLDHLRGTLVMHLPDRESATHHFEEVFDEAFAGSWATKTNWFFHAVKHTL